MVTQYNKVRWGLLVGLLVPIITIAGFYVIRFRYLSLGDFMEIMLARKVLSSIMSLCVIPNLLTFFIFIWTNLLYLARGVLMATFVYAFLILVIKFII